LALNLSYTLHQIIAMPGRKMKSKLAFVSMCFLLTISTVACTNPKLLNDKAVTTEATAKPALPSETPHATITSDLAAGNDIVFGSGLIREYVAEGGYSFERNMMCQAEDDGAMFVVVDPTGEILMAMIETSNEGRMDEERIVHYYLDAMYKKGTYEILDSNPVTIDSMEGILVDFQGTVNGQETYGQSVADLDRSDHYFFASAMGKAGLDRSEWLNIGVTFFAEILASVRFFSLEAPPSASACPVSTDTSYGYSKDNPIRVGGDAMGGPSQEEGYMEALRGPNGEAINFYRQGSLPYGSTILDIYTISYSGSNGQITIYVDEYSFETPMVPLGLSCAYPIPLLEP
jgi:hypothetical protein